MAAALHDRVERKQLVIHPAVYGELLLGGLSAKNRERVQAVGFCRPLDERAVYGFILEHRPYGVGWVDTLQLAAATRYGYTIWTRDGGLFAAARALRIPVRT